MQFLTRLPVSFLLKKTNSLVNIYTADNQSRSLKYYPVVGLIMGSLLVLLILTLDSFAKSHLLYISVICVFLWVLLSGGLHLDGVADMADAWIGGLGDKDKTLKIMKDPTCGPFGVMAIVFTIILKCVFVYELIYINIYLILFPPLFSRAAVVVLLMFAPYVRSNGIGEVLAIATYKNINLISAAFFIILGFYFLLMASDIIVIFGVIISVSLFMIFFVFNVINRLGGITGDISGAFIEYTELMVLFSIITFTFISRASV